MWQARAGRRCLAVLSAGEGSVPGGHQAGRTARGPQGTSPAAVWPGGAPHLAPHLSASPSGWACLQRLLRPGVLSTSVLVLCTLPAPSTSSNDPKPSPPSGSLSLSCPTFTSVPTLAPCPLFSDRFCRFCEELCYKFSNSIQGPGSSGVSVSCPCP